MRLILIRHGECSWNKERRIQGCRTDTSLNDRGKAQAEEVALALKEEKLTAIYSSPLSRAVNTAQPLAQIHGLEVNIDPDLREIDAGELEGLSAEEVRERYGYFWKEWRIGTGAATRLPGGESLVELQSRAWRSIQRISKRHPDGVVVVFSHLLAILAVVCRALELDLSNLLRLRQGAAAITILNLGEQGASLALFNDTCHLTDGGNTE